MGLKSRQNRVNSFFLAHCQLTAHRYRADKSAPKAVSGSKVAFGSSRDLLLEEAIE
jgi:hypothetical protein